MAGDPGEVDGTDAETIRIEPAEPVDRAVRITLSRPEARNALNERMRAELGDALGRIEDQGDARVVVLRGDEAGEAFCAGGDVAEFADRDGDEQRAASALPRIYERVEALSLPVIAAVNGHAFGGGCELALACDLRIAHASALFGQPEVTLGIIPGGGATQRLPRIVGPGTASKLILTGEFVDAAEAGEIGLVEEVHGDGAFVDRIAELAETIATNAPLAVQAAKQAISASRSQTLEDGLEYERDLVADLFDTADKAEGIAAFREDRDPEWSGE